MSTRDNLNYKIKNDGFRHRSSQPVEVVFFVKYSPLSEPPELKSITVNGRKICPLECLPLNVISESQGRYDAILDLRDIRVMGNGPVLLQFHFDSSVFAFGVSIDDRKFSLFAKFTFLELHCWSFNIRSEKFQDEFNVKSPSNIQFLHKA